MPKAKRGKPIYQRGAFRLDRRADRGNFEITWYDLKRGRERSVTAGTSDLIEARKALDRTYLDAEGTQICPTCGQARAGVESVELQQAINDYLLLNEAKASHEAMTARLNHVLAYITHIGRTDVRCTEIDEAWVAKFRVWAMAQPIKASGGTTRQRSLSTVENSVLQLAAVINQAKRQGWTPRGAAFKPIPTKSINRTPQYRADVAKVAEAFRYCLAPTASTAKMRERLIRERTHLLNFLRISIVTLARPDAAHEVSTDPAKRQWNSDRRVLSLNPDGRPQTRKYRAVVPIARHMASHLDACNGLLVPVNSVKKAHEAMAASIKLPGDGESGMKLWRRSMADILRSRMPIEKWGEIEMFLGHDRFDDVSDLYAPFRPDYLSNARAEIEAVCDEIEKLAPGSFYRNDTAQGGNIYSMGNARNG